MIYPLTLIAGSIFHSAVIPVHSLHYIMFDPSPEYQQTEGAPVCGVPEGGVSSYSNRNYMQEDQKNTHVREQPQQDDARFEGEGCG